jgi:pyruvate kinase
MASTKAPPMAKIVATIGPASEQFEVLQPAVTAGMRVMRINFSHATKEEVELRLQNLSNSKGAHASHLALANNFNLRAVLLDTKGPEIRMGGLAICQGMENRKRKILLTVRLMHWLCAAYWPDSSKPVTGR